MPLVIDETSWPLTVHVAENAIEEHEMRAYLVELDRMLARGKFGTMFDARPSAKASRAVMGLHAQWFKANAKLIEERWIALALILTSPTQRFLLSSILLITGLGVPHTVVDSVDQSRPWLRERFKSAGLPIPTQLL